MKRFISFTLVFALLLIIPALNVSAINEKKDTTADTVVQIAEDYIAKNTRDMYLFEDNKANILTIQSISDILLSSNESVEDKLTFESQRSKLSLVDDKVSYYKYIRSAQDCIVKDFTQTYTVKDCYVENDTAFVTLKENLTWQYVDYHLPSAAEINYEVTLVCVNDNWYITSVLAPQEYFDQKYIIEDLEFDLDLQIEQFDCALSEETELYDSLEGQSVSYDSEKAMTRAHSYDINAAISYAQDWAMSRNDIFIDFGDVDCMNFASQCIYAGLGGSESSIETSYMDTSGSDKTERWYWNDYESWCSCSDFRNYINGDDAALNVDITEVAMGGELASWYTITGSIAHVDTVAGGHYGHAIVFTDYESPRLQDIYYCAHSTNRLNEKFSAYYADSPAYVIEPISLG